MFRENPNLEESSSDSNSINTTRVPKITTSQHTPPPHTKSLRITHLHTSKMSNHNPEGEHSRENEQPRTKKGKYYYQDKLGEDQEEITQEDIRDCRNRKGF